MLCSSNSNVIDGTALTLEQCDPQNVIGDALGRPCPWQPHDVFLTWLIGLPEGVDPSRAAGVLVAAHQHDGNTAATLTIIDLLRQAARCKPGQPVVPGYRPANLH